MLKIYNSITRKKEEFKPLHENFVGMYVCGPTVYGPPHVGHARSYVNFDIVFRFLKYLGFKVKYVQNITDVGHLTGDSDEGDDKILKQAKLEQIDPYEISYKYETMYFNAMDKLNNLRPSISARATSFIPEMIDFVQTLINKGYGYVTEKGNVYFNVQKYAKYGQLSNRTLDKNLSGERITLADDKKSPEDFALWKKAENGHIMKWNSPWSVGYPGWHLECSTMTKKFLGDTFDIHGGGLDNIFPHHECEFAQSEICNDKKFVNFFMHNNLIAVNGTKMGKSLNNFITLEDLFKQYNPIAVRYFILQFHYRSPVDFSIDNINSAKEQFEKINSCVNNLRKITVEKSSVESPVLVQIKNEFIDAMNEDFNTPLALSVLLNLAKVINTELNTNKNLEFLKQANSLISELAENILGLTFEEQQSSNNDELLELISNVRDELRKEKNYALSDLIRNKLSELNITINDKKVVK